MKPTKQHPKQVGAFDAKTHFSELLAAVCLGQEFTITRHGHSVAKLIPFPKEETESAALCAIRDIKKLRTGITLGKDLTIKELKSQGRK
jgi:prevent-host-death family protein